MAANKWVVHFIISDTFYTHIPERKQNDIRLGTDMAHVCSSLADACRLANKLIFLTTGRQNNMIFIPGEMTRQKLSRKCWSNDMRTHHCEITRLYDDSHFTSRTRRGEPEDDEERQHVLD